MAELSDFYSSLSPAELAKILRAGTVGQREAALRQRQQQAADLMRPSGASYTNPWAAGLGGLADVLRAGAGAYQQYKAEKGLEALQGEREAGRQALLGAFQTGQQRNALTAPNVISPNLGMPGAAPEEVAAAEQSRARQQQERQRAVQQGTGYLGILSEDPGMQQFGRALLQPEQSDELRRMALEQGQERLGLQQQEATRRAGLQERMLSLKEQQAKASAANAEKAAAAKKIEDSLKLEEGLRKEVMGNPVTRSFLEAQVAYDKVRRAVKDPSAAGDLALIFGVMKTFDPGSTVREGEFANAQNTTSVPGQVMNAWNRALNGERLSPQQRADFERAAAAQFGAHRSAFETLVGGYRGITERAGANFANVLPVQVGVAPAAPTVPAAGASSADVELNAPPAAPSVLVLPDGRRVRRNPDGTYSPE